MMEETQKKLSDTIAEINNDIELANLKMIIDGILKGTD